MCLGLSFEFGGLRLCFGVWGLCGSAFKIGEGTLPLPSKNERAHNRSNDVWRSDTKEDMSDYGKGYIFGQHVW